jgi:Cu(I)/Ag(I) efflux system membrane fusion protein
MIRSFIRRFATVIIPTTVIALLILFLVLGKATRPSSTATQGDYTCSMHPQVRLPQPGRCPICGMDLIPVAKLGDEQSRVEHQAGLETETVTHRELFREIRTVGKIDYNEQRVAVLSARIAGRVDRVFADFTGITVKKGDHLVSIYSPELYSAQAELFQAADALQAAVGEKRFLETSLEAARTKLLLLGVLPDQLREIEKTRKQNTHLTIYAPIGGVVIEKNIREQQYVQAGDILYRIAELDPIWLFLNIYESDLAWVRFGQQVEVTLEAFPGEVFHGTVVFVDPFLDDVTRTVRVRVNLKNPDYRLKPAMYASASIRVGLRADGSPAPTGLEGKFVCPMHPDVIRETAGKCPECGMDLERIPEATKPLSSESAAPSLPPHQGHPENSLQSGKVLAVRTTAVLDTGRRQVVYRKRKDGAYEIVDVRLGPRAEATDSSGKRVGYFPVLSGLSDGDEAVVQGGFLLDSQRQIEGMPSLLYTDGRSASSLHAGHAPPSAPKTTKPEHQH